MIPPTLPEFLSSLDSVQWFSHVGEPIADEPNVARIHDWDEWPGPEHPPVAELSRRHQDLHDLLMSAGAPEMLKARWGEIHEKAFRRATSAVPFDPDEDAWHGPSAAVRQAAWTAGLVGLCLATNRQIPREIGEQWKWFLRGHWPCGFDHVAEPSESAELVVF